MLVFCLFTVSAFLSMLQTYLGKRFQLGFSVDIQHFITYNLLNALFASVFFFVGNGFALHINTVTFLYSTVFAVSIIITLTVNVLVLSCVSVSRLSVMTTAGSTLLSSCFGVLVLKEDLSLRLILSLICMLCAVMLPYSFNSKRIKKENNILCILPIICTGFNVILQKMYTVTDGVCDTNSFFLATNLLIVLFSGLALLVTGRKNETNGLSFHVFSARQTGNIAARTLLSNLSSVIGIYLLAHMNVSVYTVLSSACGLLSSALLSRVVFKENMRWVEKVALLLAVCAIVIGS